MTLKPALYLVPVTISNAPVDDVLPPANIGILRGISHMIVENVRTARRFLKRCDPGFDIAPVTFYELNRHTDHAAHPRQARPVVARRRRAPEPTP